VLGDVFGGQLPHQPRVGGDDDAMGGYAPNAATHAIVDVDGAVVAPTDHTVSHREFDWPVGAFLAERPESPPQLSCCVVQGRARLVLPGNHDRLDGSEYSGPPAPTRPALTLARWCHR
jgi:hypothetical protein